MKKRGVGVIVMCAMLAGPSPAWAARLRVHEAAESADYGRKAGGMLGRGLLNVGTCFIDVLAGTVNESRQGPPIIGTLVGVVKGTGCGVLRAASGVVDVGTFWVPGFNGMPVSDTYGDCLVFGASAAAPSAEEPAAAAWEQSAPMDAPAADPYGGTTQVSVPQEPAKKKWSK
jgi:putative exosortase-associated protein (TIGR04073 family)